MLILPAMDLRGGACVRLRHGDFEQETRYDGDPVEIAKGFEAEGAEWIHVVDLDAAKEGALANLAVVERVARAVSVPVQLGGGLRHRDAVMAAFDAGVQRVILGSQAANDPDWAATIFAEFGERVIVGIDAREGCVAISGWQSTLTLSATGFAQQMEQRGARRVIYTDIGRDGTLEGPNLDAMRLMLAAVRIPVIASGGVGSIDDVRALRENTACEGVIVGKAIYEGRVTVAEMVGLNAQPRMPVAR